MRQISHFNKQNKSLSGCVLDQRDNHIFGRLVFILSFTLELFQWRHTHILMDIHCTVVQLQNGHSRVMERGEEVLINSPHALQDKIA